MDEILKRDQNHVTVLAGVTNDVDKDIVMLRVDPITKRLLVTDPDAGGSGWELTGNAGTTAGTNFIGTTDAQDLVFKVNTQEKLRLINTGASNKDVGVTLGQVTSEELYIKFREDQNETLQLYSNKSGTDMTTVISNNAFSTSIFELAANGTSGYIRFTPTTAVEIRNRLPLRFWDTGNNYYAGFRAGGSMTSDITWNLPSTDSTGTQALVSDGSGNLGWASIGGGGSPGGVADSIQTNNGAGGFYGDAGFTYDGNIMFIGSPTATSFSFRTTPSPLFTFLGAPGKRVLESDLSTYATTIGDFDDYIGIGVGQYIIIDPFASSSGFEGFHYGINSGSGYDPYFLVDPYGVSLFHDMKIIFDANTPPSTERQLAYDDTQKTLALFSGGTQQNAVQCVFTQDRTVNIANTTATTSLLNTGWGSATFPADFFVPGKTVEFEVSGFMSATGGPNMTPTVKLGTVPLASATVASNNGTNIGFIAKGKITCKTAGASGTFAVTGFFQENKTGGALIGLVNTTTASVDTTVSNAFDFTFAWGTASASNTITSQVVTLIVLN